MNTLLMVVTFIQGVAAGICIDVATVKLPTRHRIGTLAYAQFARSNDLHYGLRIYPFVVVGGGALLIASTVAAHLGAQPSTVRYPLYAAALASVGYLVATLKAAPIMWSLKKTPDNEHVLAQKLDRFTFWHTVRTVFVIAAFVAMLWAVS
jgi:hypothetical protein